MIHVYYLFSMLYQVFLRFKETNIRLSSIFSSYKFHRKNLILNNCYYTIYKKLKLHFLNVVSREDYDYTIKIKS